MKNQLLHTASPPLDGARGKPLRSGYTTGACATAAAKGAALMLVHQITVSEVTIELPAGISATFRLSGQNYSANSATCFVIKDAGDDPDVTNGAEVHAAIQRTADPQAVNGRIVISGGKGIGAVTKPGLAVPPGEWAINPVPRQMIEEAVTCVVFPAPDSRTRITDAFHVTISIPDGEERSKKTLNARLGIIGGLSILGTTGIVRPVSAKAWTDTIDAALDVARACGCETVVLSTGRTSETAAQNFLRRQSLGARHTATLFDHSPAPSPSGPTTGSHDFPEEAFIMMGDHIAYALQACQKRGFNHPIITCQFAKLLKIACGHENTHAAASELDIEQLLAWGQDGGLSDLTLATVSAANTAREIAIASSFDPVLLNLVFQHARCAVARHAPELHTHFLVADYSGNCIFDSR